MVYINRPGPGKLNIPEERKKVGIYQISIEVPMGNSAG